MKDKINKLARGIVDLSAPSLYVAESSLEGELEPGENERFRLNISSRNGVSMKGLVYSDHIFVKVERAAFGGIRSSVPLLVEGGDLSAGEELKGKLSVISNGGELQIPYCFRARLSPELREIRRLRRTEDFLRLYEEDPKLALQLFRRKDFREAPFLEDSRARLYFRAFSGNAGNAGKRELQEFSAALRRQSRGAETERRERGAETGTAPFGERSFYLSEEELKDPRRVEEMARRLIEADIADPEAFLIYQRAIENGSRLTRLYEYCIYALPDSEIELPRELYLYFAYESRLEERMKLPLYSNVLRNFQEDSDIYQSFEREIQRFAIDKLLAGKIDERLSLIYERMIYPDMVDRRIARVLPQLLYTCEVFVEDPRMKKLILLQPELRREESFPIRDGRVFFPQYFPEAVILFQDEEGRRYGGVPYEKRRLLHKPELEKRCMELVPEQVFFRLLRAEQVLRSGIRSTAELAFLEKESESPLISSDFRHAILVSVLRCHSKLTEREAASLTKRDLDYLKGIAKEGKSLGERTLLFSDLLKRGEYESASELLLSHRIGWDRLLISDFFHGSMERESHEELFLLEGKKLFDSGAGDFTLLQFLLEHYNGLSDEMDRILRRALEKERGEDARETGGFREAERSMAERLLAQLLFTERREKLDEVYDIYASLGGGELLKRAWLSQRAADYFLLGRSVPERIFQLLGEEIDSESRIEKIPLLYLLSLSLHYSEKKSLTEKERELLSGILRELRRKNIFFRYMEKFRDSPLLPELPAGRNFLEYRGEREGKPRLFVRILPGEKNFHEEEFQRAFQNIYTAALPLFAGEEAEYRIYEGNGTEPVKSGSIRPERTAGWAENGLFGLLDRMGRLYEEGRGEELRDTMLLYLEKEAMIETLFSD